MCLPPHKENRVLGVAGRPQALSPEQSARKRAGTLVRALQRDKLAACQSPGSVLKSMSIVEIWPCTISDSGRSTESSPLGPRLLRQVR